MKMAILLIVSHKKERDRKEALYFTEDPIYSSTV
jgi:hypothetical protein